MTMKIVCLFRRPSLSDFKRVLERLISGLFEPFDTVQYTSRPFREEYLSIRGNVLYRGSQLLTRYSTPLRRLCPYLRSVDDVFQNGNHGRHFADATTDDDRVSNDKGVNTSSRLLVSA